MIGKVVCQPVPILYAGHLMDMQWRACRGSPEVPGIRVNEIRGVRRAVVPLLLVVARGGGACEGLSWVGYRCYIGEICHLLRCFSRRNRAVGLSSADV